MYSTSLENSRDLLYFSIKLYTTYKTKNNTESEKNNVGNQRRSAS